jgi:hypothetical protein
MLMHDNTEASWEIEGSISGGHRGEFGDLGDRRAFAARHKNGIARRVKGEQS